MKEFLEIVSEEMKQAFEKAGYPAEYGKVNVSNRPDLCELQCNGAMALAKQFKKAPIMIANAVADALADSKVFSKVEAVMPGFLNCDIASAADGRSRQVWSGKTGKDQKDRDRLRRTECGKTAPCRTSAFCRDR